MKDDLFGFSPDIGKYVMRDGKTYSEHGRVYDEGAMFRAVGYEHGAHENYADWTSDRRAERVAELTREHEEYKAEREAKHRTLVALVESAKAKLTEEEYRAIVQLEQWND